MLYPKRSRNGSLATVVTGTLHRKYMTMKQQRPVVLIISAFALLVLSIITLLSVYPTTVDRDTEKVTSRFLHVHSHSDNEEDVPPLHSPLHENITTLVICAGHAILSSLALQNFTQPSAWTLESYQSKQLTTFLAHIEASVVRASEDLNSLLLFSGGETRALAGPRSEALSYWLIAEFNSWFQNSPAVKSHSVYNVSDIRHVRMRTSTEEFARDSFENLLFSVCRFQEITGHYPTTIVIFGFEFKRQRFQDLHRAAIRWPAEQFEYVGIDPDESDMSGEEQQLAKVQRERGELENSVKHFEADPYGCREHLRQKRMLRNPFARSSGYGHHYSCPEMMGLLHYCGPDFYHDPLPWNTVE